MKIIGHRGARGLAPENTLAGFKKALGLGVDMIEFDVRVTSDNVPVLNHNRTIKTVSGKKYKITAHSYEYLKKRKSDLTTLDEALDFINGRVPLDIEIKPRVDTRPVTNHLAHYKCKYIISSKSWPVLNRLRKELPDAPRVVVTAEPGLRSLRRAKKANSKILMLNQRLLWPGIIKRLKKRGYTVYSYTVNNPADAKKLAEAGLDGIVTDFPDRFV